AKPKTIPKNPIPTRVLTKLTPVTEKMRSRIAAKPASSNNNLTALLSVGPTYEARGRLIHLVRENTMMTPAPDTNTTSIKWTASRFRSSVVRIQDRRTYHDVNTTNNERIRKTSFSRKVIPGKDLQLLSHVFSRLSRREVYSPGLRGEL